MSQSTIYENYQMLLFERDGPVLKVSLNNPEVGNAINGLMHEELSRVFREIATDNLAKVVILTGSVDGEAFCKGADPTAVQGELDDIHARFPLLMQAAYEIVSSLCAVPQPVVAMINGDVFGLGATLALFCDVAFMDENGNIADPHVLGGMVAGDGGAVIWPLLIGPNRAKEFLMTGDPITAREAAAMGLINHAVPASELEARTFAFAERLASRPTLAVQLTKRAVNLGVNQMVNQILQASLAMEGLTLYSEDCRNAIQATVAANSEEGS